jgi:Periplasmic binding protein
MMPSSSSPSGSEGGGSGLRRWGPLIAIVVVLALVAGVVLLGGDDGDQEDTATETTEAGSTDSPTGAITFSQAQEEGLDVEFSDTCDPETGRLNFPSYFAPECYANVEDNGGATDDGVTADSIKVVVYLAPDDDPILDFILGSIQNDDTSADFQATYEGYNEMFNRVYQTYGRTVELEFLRGSGNATDAEAARADAIRAAEEMGAFAVWGSPALNAGWSEELNARGVLCIGCFAIPEPEPAVFSTTASPDQTRVQLAEYIVKKLAGKPAVHAGDEAMRDQERVFAHLWIEASPDSAPNAQELRDDLASQGVDLVESIPFDIQRAGEQAPGIITRLKEAGVTSLIIQGDPSTPALFTQAATAQEWFPEWIIGGSALMDTTAFARSYDQEQWSHAFGISSLAARSAPGVGGSEYIYDWYFGSLPPADDSSGVILPNPQIFFGALQDAGPNLTTEAMVEALYRIDLVDDTVTQVGFAYGDHGYYPTLRVPDHNGIEDFTEIWYDPTVPGIDEIGREGVGAYQYVDGGRRYLPGTWTDEDRAFDPEGAIAVYEEPPERERAPDVPRPA